MLLVPLGAGKNNIISCSSFFFRILKPTRGSLHHCALCSRDSLWAPRHCLLELWGLFSRVALQMDSVSTGARNNTRCWHHHALWKSLGAWEHSKDCLSTSEDKMSLKFLAFPLLSYLLLRCTGDWWTCRVHSLECWEGQLPLQALFWWSVPPCFSGRPDLSSCPRVCTPSLVPTLDWCPKYVHTSVPSLATSRFCISQCSVVPSCWLWVSTGCLFPLAKCCSSKQ